MNKPRKIIAGFFVISILVIAGLYALYLIKSNNAAVSIPGINETVLYYGEECPHCKIVEAFIANNSIDSKINIINKEIWHNATNAKESLAVIKFCKINPNTAGVPLMFTNNTCYMGDEPIISFFKTKLNITSS